MEEERELTVTERIMLETDDIYTGSPSAEQEISDAQLHVEPWNRTTIADGLWLQENAIAPFSARDIMLANEIDKTNERVSELEENTTDGREVRSFSPRVWSGDDTSWRNIHNTRVIPDDELIPKNSLMYMPVIYSSSTVGDTSEGGVLSMNSKNKSFQLGISEAGLWWDFGDPNNTTTTVNGDYGSFKVDTKSGKTPMKIYSEFDKPKDNSVKVFTSAGFETLSGDGLTIEIYKNGNTHVVSARNYPGWYKTVNHAIETETPPDDESYLAGGGCTVASAKYSLLLGAGSDFNGLVEYSDVHAAGGQLPETSQIRYSYLNHGGFVVGENVKIENAIVNADRGIPDDTHLDSSFVIIDGADFSGSIKDSVAVKSGGSVSGAQYSLVLGSGGDQKNISSSLIAEQGSNLENIDRSIAVGNVFAKNHDYLLAVGGGFHLENASGYGNVIVGDGFTQNYPLDYNVLVGGNNCVVNRASKSSIGVGENLYLGGYGNLAVGSAIYVKGRAQVVVGSANNAWDSHFGDGSNLLMGWNNNSDAVCTVAAGSSNSIYGKHSIVLGDSNMLSQYGDYSITLGDRNVQGYNAIHGIIAGNGNTAWSERAYIFGDDNKAGGSQAMILGDDNDVAPSAGMFIGYGNYGTKHDTLVVGDDNRCFGDYSFILGQANVVSHYNCLVAGEGLNTTKDGQVLLGQYTLSLTDSVLEIGCGLNATSKKTLFRIDAAGNVWCAGVLHCQSVTQHNTYPSPMQTT